MTVLPKKGDVDFTGWYNMTNGDQRIVYDAMLDAWFYPYLTDMLDMTRVEHQKFIDKLNKSKYANIGDWVFAHYEQSDAMKMSFGLMAENLEEFSFGPPGGPRGPSSPYLAWPVVPADYFDVTSVQYLEPIFGMMPIPTYNGRICSGWSLRRDGMNMALPPDVAWRLGEVDDHFVAHELKTPGMDATITFNHDTHDIPDDQITRIGFPGPLGAWLASVKGPSYLNIAIDIKPGDDKNMVAYKEGEPLPVVLFGNKHFDLANMIDPASIWLDKMTVKMVNDKPVFKIADVNDDGIDDIIVQIVMNNTGNKRVFMATVKGNLKANYSGCMVLGKQEMTFTDLEKSGIASAPECSNYPNPFNPETHITFNLPNDANVVIKVYNALGQQLRSLTNNSTYEAGSHSVLWDGKDAFGIEVASGVYIYQFKADDFTQVKPDVTDSLMFFNRKDAEEKRKGRSD